MNKLKKPAPEPVKPAPRLCPYCKSEIAEDATRCPHCTSQL
jgi:large conductance mechanosensitive channel